MMTTFQKIALVFAGSALFLEGSNRAQAGQTDFSGQAAFEKRTFVSSALYPEQSDRPQVSFTLEPRLRINSEDRSNQFVITAFARWDGIDENRSHFDLREAYWRNTSGNFQVLAGFNRIFWGVAESRHLVDIINQTDAVEDIDGEAKLGQPMIALGKQTEWGEWQLFVLPYFRERTFPGTEGRFRTPLPVSSDAVYESKAEEWHTDFALRYSHYFGDWDFGAHYFRGTSREPLLLPDASESTLVPYYALIDRFGIDVQYTRNAWLWKFEGIVSSGQGDTFAAAVGGFEYTMYQLERSAVDLGLLVEYHRDGRDENAPPTIYDNELFLGARLAWNDAQDTSILLGTLVDTKTSSTMAVLEAERRLGDSWKIEVTARFFMNVDPADPAYTFHRDDFIDFSLQRHF